MRETNLYKEAHMMKSSIIASNHSNVNSFLVKKFSGKIHAKRLESLCNAVRGAMTSHSLQPSKIGDGLAESKGLLPKHARKQVDRLISNAAIEAGVFQSELCDLLIHNRSRIMVSMDWTVFAKDKHMTITLRLVTTHGRATPLLWKTVEYKNLKGNKNKYVFEILSRLRKLVSNNCQVIILADREFGTLNCMEKIKKELNFDYILRIKRNFTVTDKNLIKKQAHEWLDSNNATCIDNAKVTVKNYSVKKIIVCKEPGMKDIWCIACSIGNIATQTVLNLYGKRWSTECSYRDEKDIYFGMGLKKARISKVEPRQRLLLISAIIIIFLTLLGAASEASGFDKYLKSNTVKRRTHSLFTQGKLVLRLMKNMDDEWKESITKYFLEYCQGLNSIVADQYFV